MTYCSQIVRSFRVQVGVVVFSTEAFTPTGTPKVRCYSRELSFATSENRAYLQSYIDGIQAKDGTNYTAALVKAFGLLAKSRGLGPGRRGERAVVSETFADRKIFNSRYTCEKPKPDLCR